MLFPLPVNLFQDDCIRKLDLHRFRDFLFENYTEQSTSSASSGGSLLMDILMKEGGESNEQDLASSLLKPLQYLPPGKLPGVLLDPETLKSTLPTSIFSSTSASAATPTVSIGNSPKRRKIDNQQNITIQHF